LSLSDKSPARQHPDRENKFQSVMNPHQQSYNEKVLYDWTQLTICWCGLITDCNLFCRSGCCLTGLLASSDKCNKTFFVEISSKVGANKWKRSLVWSSVKLKKLFWCICNFLMILHWCVKSIGLNYTTLGSLSNLTLKAVEKISKF